MRLVRTVDKLLDILDHDDKFSYFMLDGQTIVLDDYLEVRPEQEEHLKRYTRAGRVLVGPWYLQPDEFLVSGESLVRNLQIGLQRAAEFGEPMRVGYVPDCFGHIAQLPQILRGFDIDSAIFWRGVGAEAHKSEFYWAAPDGTSILVVHLADARGYSNASIMPLVLEEFVTRVELLTASLLGKGTTSTLLFMNGSDHQDPQDGLPAVITAANTLLAHIDPEHEKLIASFAGQNGNIPQYDSIHLRIGTLPQYVAVVREHIASQQGTASPLQTLSGEMRSSQYAHLLPAVLSTRMWIKQQNTLTEHLLERWKQELGSMSVAREELAATLALSGVTAPGQFIHLAHETIKVMLNRPDDPLVITHVHVTDHTDAPGVVHIEVIVAPRGQVVSSEQELLAAEQQVLAFLNREDIVTLQFSLVEQVRETIDFVATDLPAYGLKTYWLYPRGIKGEKRPEPVTTLAGQQAGETTPRSFIENVFFRVEVNVEDGTLTVTDKQTAAVFTGLNRFVDDGDVGDLYTYCPPEHDLIISKPVEPPRIELVSAGPVHAMLRIRGRWSLPTTCAPGRAERSSRTTVCTMTSEVSLFPGVRRIDIHTSVENAVKDHRLRVIFPVPYNVKSASAEGTFEVRSRPVTSLRPADVAEWIEAPVNTFPQKRFVDVSNGTLGLGVLNRGLPEYEVVRDGPTVAPGQVAVALTLLRCVEWLSRGDLATRQGHAGPMEYTPEAQCQGHHEFDYALVPHSGEWQAEHALVLREAQAFNTPVRAVVTGQHPGRHLSRAALVEVEPPELVVSAIKRGNAGEGLVVRVYNPLDHAVEASLRPGIAATRAFVTNLHEEQREQLFWSGEGDEGHVSEPVHVGMRAGEILTILFQ